MACALSQGYVNDCRDNMGGAKELMIIEFDNVEDITITADVVTAIDNVVAKRWWKYRPARETAFGKSTISPNSPNGTNFYAQEVSMSLNKLQTNTSLEISKLAQNLLLIVVTDQNDRHWLYGVQNGLEVSGGEAGTGTAPGDRNGYVVTFSGSEPALPLEVDAATYATLETPGV